MLVQPPSRPTRRKFTQTYNCSDRRALVCSDGAAVAREGRPSVREAGGRAEPSGAGSRAPVRPGPSASPDRHVSPTVRKPAGTVGGPSRHKQMLSGYCCSAYLVIVFLQGRPVEQGARLCCGKELWRTGSTECIKLFSIRLSSLLLVLHVVWITADKRERLSNGISNTIYTLFIYIFLQVSACIFFSYILFLLMPLIPLYIYTRLRLTTSVLWYYEVGLPSQTLSSLLMYRKQLMHYTCVKHWVLPCDPMSKKKGLFN